MASSPTSAPPPTSSLTPPESSTPPPNVTANPPTSPASAPPPPNVTASPPTSPASAPPPPNVTANPPTSPASAPPPPNVTASPPTSPASAPPPPNVTANPPTSPASAPPPPNVTANPPTSPASAPPPPNVTANPPTSPASAPPTSPASAPPPSNVTANPPTSPASAPPPPNVTANPPTSPASAPPPPNVAVNPPTSAPRPATPSSGSPSPPSTATPSPPSIASASPPSSGGEGGSSPPPPSDSTQGSDNGGSSSSSTGLVVGLVVGGVVLLVLLACVYIYCKGKRRDGRYYGGPSPPPTRKGDGYSGQPQNRQYNAPAPEDHAIKIPHFSPPPKQASWQPQFPSQHHPPRMFSSSGASGSSYSGSETPQHQPSPEMALGFSKSTFTFEELVRATDGFSNANLLGQGGFGYVHRGVLPNGKEVAVKQLKIGSGQGEREFQAEVEIITRVHHKHLVSLIGYCITGEKRLLVYAFVPNNTMEFHLHGKGRPTMDWSTRLKIGLGSAKGLAYLHEDCHPKIIHRDIKAANILLDYNFEAKVADFGLAKFSADDNTHVSTRVMGTFGYLAPEYASSGKLTEKSDVFSFGVILLELITGRRPVDTSDTFRDDSLVDWARPLLSRAIEDDNYAFLADPRLQHNYNTQEMAHMVACAAVCVRHSARRRPRMTQIVRVLEGDVSLDDLNEGVRPGHSTVYGSVGSSDYDSGQYNEDMKKFRKLAFSSQEYASSEYSAATSEYGQNPSSSGSEKTMKKDSKGFR